MRISEKADRQGREADGSTPVRRKAERGRSGKANSVTPTNKKLAEMRAFFGIGVRMRISTACHLLGIFALVYFFCTRRLKIPSYLAHIVEEGCYGHTRT